MADTAQPANQLPARALMLQRRSAVGIRRRVPRSTRRNVFRYARASTPRSRRTIRRACGGRRASTSCCSSIGSGRRRPDCICWAATGRVSSGCLREIRGATCGAAHDMLPLVCLGRGDCRSLARRLSCDQDIAADGFFSLGMIAEFDASLDEHGPSFYRHLFWESGSSGRFCISRRKRPACGPPESAAFMTIRSTMCWACRITRFRASITSPSGCRSRTRGSRAEPGYWSG